jgi:hypothetical protein
LKGVKVPVDKVKRNRVCLFLAGFLLFFLGLYLLSLTLDFIASSVSGAVFGAGVSLLLSGATYKETLKTKPLTGVERAEYIRSSHFKISLTGTILLFGGFGGVGVAPENIKIWFLTLAVIGVIILVAAWFYKPQNTQTTPTQMH